MTQRVRAAILIAAFSFLAACTPSNDNIRVIQSGGPVLHVTIRHGHRFVTFNLHR